MAIKRISEDRFHRFNVQKNEMAIAFGEEIDWFEDTGNNLLATIINDRIDKDWSYVILAKEENDEYRAVDLEVSLESQEFAEDALRNKLTTYVKAGEIREELYVDNTEFDKPTQNIIITSIDDQVKRYFKKHPEKLYELSPRKFEELIASILEDMGLSIKLTQATRDGGSDIIAEIKNSLTSLLILVECKRYAPDNKVGVGIVRQVAGIHLLKEAAKSIIVTTSTFTKDAIEEANQLKSKIDLKDYDNLKEWLKNY